MSTPKLTLTYFASPGRAEPIRIACAVSDIAFTNKVLSYAEFAQAIPNLPLGQVPTLDIETDGTKKTLTQTSAILRYVGKLGGLYPKDDDIAAAEIDETLAVMDDYRNPLVTTIMGKAKALLSDGESFTDEEKMAIRERWIKICAPRHLGFLEKKLSSSTSGFLVGDSLTIADLSLYSDLTWLQSGALDGIPTDVVNSYPACLKFIDKVKEHEGVKKWTGKYSKPYETFDYEP